MWVEISSELAAEGVRPTTPDAEALETITRAATERAKGVMMLQGELLEAEEQQNLQDENQFYAEVCQWAHQARFCWFYCLRNSCFERKN